MSTSEKRIDKSGWGSGPWCNEPDRINFKTEEGFDAVILRSSSSGHLCGYVGVPASHPWHGMEYGATVKPTAAQLSAPVDPDRISLISVLAAGLSSEDIESGARIDCLISVHGGLTYSGRGNAAYGESVDDWYFGFDCAHSGDLCPAHDTYFRSDYDTYRDVDYVRAEIVDLSKQLAATAQ